MQFPLIHLLHLANITYETNTHNFVYKCNVAHPNNFLDEELGKNLIFSSTWYIGIFLPEDRAVIKFKQEAETHDKVTRGQVVLFASNHETACGQVLSSRSCLRHLVTLHPPCICDDFSIPGNTTKAHEQSTCILNLLTLRKKMKPCIMLVLYQLLCMK